jgi:ABC-type branched-subunit amino acid transport system ATPase component
MSALLEVRNARVSFGGLRAVDDVSLDVAHGAIVGLIGPNGAGKTTTFNTISGLQAIDSGTIRFDDRDVTALPTHERARLGIGRSFQHLGLMPTESALINLLAAQHLSARWRNRGVLAARAEAALDRFGLLEQRHSAVEDLSFAAARFVELAAVLVEQPTLMLLDEPTTGLDVAEIARLRAVLADTRSGGTTILVIAHDVEFVMGLCDHVYVLAQGQVLAAGTPRDVQRDARVVEAYLGVPA